jgi:hypothetical protein
VDFCALLAMTELYFGSWIGWLPILGVAAAGLAWWLYHRPAIALENNIKWLLRTLRWLVFIWLIVLLLEPFFSSISPREFPPIVAIVHDNSESLVAGKDSAWFRSADHRKALNELINKLQAAGASVQLYAFGAETQSISAADSLKYTAGSTDIAGALISTAQKYNDQNLGAVILYSDGIATSGRNPVFAIENYRQPVFAVWGGDTAAQKDLIIESVLHNEISYLDTETPITVTVAANRFETKEVELRLTQQGKVLQSRRFAIGGSQPRQQIQFTTLLDKIGLQQFELHLTELEGEQNKQNNHKLFFIHVLENRLKIAVFAGAAHPDIGCFYKVFGRNPRFSFKEFIRKSEAEFYQMPTDADIAETDLYILHNFPAGVNDREILEKIYAQVEKNRRPLINIIGGNLSLTISPRQQEFIGLTTNRFSNRTDEALIYLSPNYENHVTGNIDRKFYALLESAPPLLRNETVWQLAPGSEVFGKAKIKGIRLDYPLFVLQDHNGRKVMTLLGEGIWRYRMHTYLETGAFTLFDDWIQGLTQWLTTREDKRKFRVYPVKNLFSGDERIIFKGQAYDDSYNPLSQAEIKLVITDASERKFDYYLTEAQAGNYILELNNLAEGTYRYTATGAVKNKVIGTDGGQFSVGRSDIEFTRLQADIETMRQIAHRTGGNLMYVRNTGTLADSVLSRPGMRPVIEYARNTLSLNRFRWPLILAILLLTTEWIIRKRNGLV